MAKKKAQERKQYVTVRCVSCKATKQIYPGKSRGYVPICDDCYSPMVVVGAVSR
jgi:hypothetical protein